MDELTSITQIDLSYAQIPVDLDQIGLLIEKLENLPSLKVIILEPKSENNSFITALKKHRWTLLERLDLATKHMEFEVSLLPPNYSRMLQIFDGLPNRIIHQPLDKINPPLAKIGSNP